MDIQSYKDYYSALPEWFMPNEVKRIFCRIPSQWNYLLEMSIMETTNKVKDSRTKELVIGSHEYFLSGEVDKMFERMMRQEIGFTIQNQKLLLTDKAGNIEPVLAWFRKEIER